MSLDELLGARLIVGWPGPEATPDVLETLRATHAQGLIVFERNFVSVGQFTALLRQLQAAADQRLLVMVDHEGGRIIRFREGVTRFPAALTHASTGSPEAVQRQGAVEGQELRRLGVHVNLAPCVDVLVEGSDPIIGDRSYGTDPSFVSRCATARIKGLQSQGVGACAKHFPGLGAVPTDPHTLLPTVSLSPEDMERGHLPPFRAAIEADAALIMSSHVCYPALGDPAGLPATCSARLIRGLLRERLGFQGVTITDDLEMGALRDIGDVGACAVRAAEAGHDLLLICSGPTPAKVALASLKAAATAGRLDRQELERSVERIQRLRRHYLPG